MSSDNNKHTLPPPGPSPELARAFGLTTTGGGDTDGAKGALAPLRVRWIDTRGRHTVDLDRTRVFGSSENVDVVVANPTVSRIHAEIEVSAQGGAWVRDLDSRNGTFIDRVEVRAARIAAGQTLRLGSAELEIEGLPQKSSSVSGAELWPEPWFGPLIGESEPMRELFATLALVAATDIPVFIRGETGSGKELVARAVHEASPRAKRPYVVVDCASLTESLLESELFGHARGAFTGATSSREGAIEAANGGTVFLDEIGELPLDMQPKLLRVLEQRTVRRVGESEHRPVDVRFIAATHRDLVDFVARGWFREDLYFRLAVLPVRVPPLRERMEDLEPLVRHFLGPSAIELVTPAFMSALTSRSFRGNVRELRNLLERVRALGVERGLSSGGGRGESEVLWGSEMQTAPGKIGAVAAAAGAFATPLPSAPLAPLALRDSSIPLPPALLDLSHREFRDRWVEIGEKFYLEKKLAKHDGNVSRVSREIELARTYTHKLIRKHGL